MCANVRISSSPQIFMYYFLFILSLSLSLSLSPSPSLPISLHRYVALYPFIATNLYCAYKFLLDIPSFFMCSHFYPHFPSIRFIAFQSLLSHFSLTQCFTAYSLVHFLLLQFLFTYLVTTIHKINIYDYVLYIEKTINL